MVRAERHFDYVTVGHVARDVIEGSSGTIVQPGGGAFYSALQASRLGLRTLVLTQGVPEEIYAMLAPYMHEFELKVIPAEHTTTLASYSTGRSSSQRVLSWAGAIVQSIEIDAEILHLAPIARETPTSWSGAPRLVGVTPQGLVRRWTAPEGVPLVQLDTSSSLGDVPLVAPEDVPLPGEISLVALEPTMLPEHFDAAVISDGERGSCKALFPAALRGHAPLVVTAGPRPTTVHLPDGSGIVQTVIPPADTVRDDVGAGDVFAAAFFIALSEGMSPLRSAEFGNAAAAVRLAGIGPAAIGTRAQIQRVAHALGDEPTSST
jgi:sugar/nucleoside kinase (ribokinase family)